MRRARGLPAGSENVPMVTQSLQDKQKTHICCKCLRIGSKLNWESGEEKEMAARKEVWLQVEVLQPPRERWCRCEQVGPSPSFHCGEVEKRYVMVPVRLMLGVFMFQNNLRGQVE